jgi:SAM-dependent methyltransferase
MSESLGPRGYDLMFDLVAELDLPPGSAALDVGAREGYYCVELSRRHGFIVHGVEPVRAERLAEPDQSMDLIWCRDVLVHVADLDAVFREFRRVLRPGGAAVIYQMTATDWLTPAEAERMWPPAGSYASSVDPDRFEAAIAAGGLSVRQRTELGGEWRERAEEDGAGISSKQLLYVSRMLRNRPAYEQRFGTAAYEALLTNYLWGVYQMIGKLNPRVYVLSR